MLLARKLVVRKAYIFWLPQEEEQNVFYKVVLCWIFTIRTYKMAVPRRRGRDVTLAFSRIINVNIFLCKLHY
jgi:hypothetical protein